MNNKTRDQVSTLNSLADHAEAMGQYEQAATLRVQAQFLSANAEPKEEATKKLLAPEEMEELMTKRLSKVCPKFLICTNTCREGKEACTQNVG